MSNAVGLSFLSKAIILFEKTNKKGKKFKDGVKCEIWGVCSSFKAIKPMNLNAINKKFFGEIFLTCNY